MLITQGSFATNRAYIDNNWVDGGIKVADNKLNAIICNVDFNFMLFSF